jgi:O-antigen ligase
MEKSNKYMFNYKLILIFITIVFFSGFINIPFNTNLNIATVAIDSISFAMLFITIIHTIKIKKIYIDKFIIFYLTFFILFLLYTLFSPESFYNKLLSFREQVMYMFICIFIYKFISLDKSIEKIVNYIIKLGIIFALFGIFQFVFRSHLPTWLLTTKSDGLYGYYGTDIIRATGLLGNTIIYGNIMLLFFSICLNKFLINGKFKNLLYCLITMAAVFATFSRIAIIGVGIIGILSIINNYHKKMSIKKIIITTFILIVTIGLLNSNVIQSKIQSSFIYSGLFQSNNASVQGSTSGHISFLQEGLKVIGSNFWFGTGIATQRAGSVYSATNVYITDSALVSFFSESGVFLFAIYTGIIVIALNIVRKTKKIFKYSYLATGLCLFSLYDLTFASLINSSYFGKSFYIIYWALIGCTLAVYKKHKINKLI